LVHVARANRSSAKRVLAVAFVTGAFVATVLITPRATAAGPNCFVGQITNSVAPNLSAPNPTYPGQTITSSGGTWTSCNEPFTGFYKQWIRNGVVLSETFVAGSPISFTYTAGVADIGTQLRSAVKPCNPDGCYSSFVVSSNQITPADRAPAVPANLAPADGVNADSTNPTLSATFSDPDGQSGWVTYTIWRASDGVVVATGNGTAVPTGGISSWTVTGDLLDADSEYDWSAVGVDSYGVSSAPTGAARYRPTRGTISYYADSTDPSFWYGAGQDLGQQVLTRALKLKRLFVILDWGAQTRDTGAWGTRTPDDYSLPTNEAIRRAASQFGKGFYEGTGGAHWAHLRIVLGTNNAGLIQDSGYAGGAAWGQLVNQTNSWFQNNGPTQWPFSQQVLAQGANDIESGIDYCNPVGKPWRQCPDTARAWADGYTATGNVAFFNYGDCAGCPDNRLPQSGDRIGPLNPDAGWQVSDVWYVSWGAQDAWPAPEIYRTDGTQAAQWERIAEYSHGRQYGDMRFTASLSQHGSCLEDKCAVGGSVDNLARAAYGQLWRALNRSDDRYNHAAPSYVIQTTRPKFSTDIRHYYP